VSSTTEEKLVRTPVLNLLTVSVLVNSAKVQNDAKEIPASVKQSIEALVKQAVGFRDSTDQFNLEFFEFVDLLPTEETPASAIPWDQINSVLKNISLGVAALIALFLGLKTLRTFQPAPSSGTAGAASNGPQTSQVSQLSELVKQNPEVFSRIIAAWANDEQPAKSDKSKAA
jgi:flagellar biosynthesis/type III secretory pathway M-ring protein FliF/YscJ